MHPEIDSKLTAVLQTYNTTLKPLIAKVEACMNEFPPQIFNEIRAIFDHIARINNEDVDCSLKELDKAENHLSRCILDCYKILYVCYSEDTKRISKKINAQSLLADDSFGLQFLQLQSLAKNKYIDARSAEYEKPELGIIINKYKEAVDACVELESFIAKNSFVFKWTFRKQKNMIVLMLIGTVMGFLLSFLIGKLI